MRTFTRFAFLALPVFGISLIAAESQIPAGMWRLNSERVIKGDAPSYSRGIVMAMEGSSRVAKFDRPIPTGVVGHDRIKTKVSPDGRTLTWDATGVNGRNGEPYRYILVWEKR